MSEEKKPLSSAETLRRFKDKKPRRARMLALYALSAALVFLLFALIRPQGGPEAEKEERTPFVLIQRDRTLLHAITVERPPNAPYTLINQNDYDLSDKNDVLGEEYALEGDPDFEVSTLQVLPMERYASDLTVEEMAEQNPKDLDQYGLKEPWMTVTIGYRDGLTQALHFGGLVPAGGYYYLQRAGDPGVYIAAESIVKAFDRALNELEQTAEEKESLNAAREAEAKEQPGALDAAVQPGEPEPTVQPGGADIAAQAPSNGVAAQAP